MAAFDAPVTVVAAASRTVGALTTSSLDTALSRLNLLVNVTAITGTLDVKVLWSHDGSVFGEPESSDSFTQITATGAVVKSFTVKGPHYKITHTVGGTSANYSISAYDTFA